MSRDTKKTVPLPYQEWWQTIGHRRRRGREVVFQMGRAPINLPPHPARLELLRMVAPLEEDLSTATTEQLLNTAPGGFFGKSNGRHVQKAGMPRSFSGECCQVIHEQAPIESFDVQEVYRGCTLFQSCSPGFIQKLMATGGTTARQGKIFECGSCIYQEGQRGSSMFVIVRGTVALVAGANKQVVGAGDCIGVAQGLGVLAERQETALAETSVQVLEVTLSALTTIFTEKEEFYSPSCFGGHSSGNLYNRERRHFELEIRRLGALRSDGGSGVRGLRSGRGPSKARRKNEDGPGRAMQPTKSLKRGTLSPRKVACAEEAEERIQGHISCLQHPRLWRQQVQQLQRELIDGDFNEGRALREAFLQSLSSSITQDFNNGYQQPLDSPIRANMDERPHGALTGASAHGAASAHGTASAGVEEEVEEVTTGMLELSLLPCFPDMSCKQKVDLFHHMNAQNKAQAARSRLSGPHSARLSSRGHEE